MNLSFKGIMLASFPGPIPCSFSFSAIIIIMLIGYTCMSTTLKKVIITKTTLKKLIIIRQ